MDRRQLFQVVLEALKADMKVYFQPPSDITMTYPCIAYGYERGSTKFANNRPYSYEQQYEVKLISREPEPELFEKLRNLPKSLHARSYVTDNLNHSVFSIYF